MDEELLEKIQRRKKMMYVGNGMFRRIATVKSALLNQFCRAIPCPFCLVEKEGGFPSKEATFFQKVRDETEEIRGQENMRLSPLHYGRSSPNFENKRAGFFSRLFSNTRKQSTHIFNCSKAIERGETAKEKALNDPYTLWEDCLDLFEQHEYNLDLLIRHRGALTEYQLFLEDGGNDGVTYFEKNEIAGKILSKWMSHDEKVKIITHMKNQENTFLRNLFTGMIFNEFVDRRVI